MELPTALTPPPFSALVSLLRAITVSETEDLSIVDELQFAHGVRFELLVSLTV